MNECQCNVALGPSAVVEGLSHVRQTAKLSILLPSVPAPIVTRRARFTIVHEGLQSSPVVIHELRLNTMPRWTDGSRHSTQRMAPPLLLLRLRGAVHMDKVLETTCEDGTLGPLGGSRGTPRRTNKHRYDIASGRHRRYLVLADRFVR